MWRDGDLFRSGMRAPGGTPMRRRKHPIKKVVACVRLRGIGKAIWRVISVLLVIILLLGLALNVYMIAARLITRDPQPTVFGWSYAVVVSGSMSGSIEMNDLIVFHREPPYAVGDVVTFRSTGGAVVTHRIVGEENGAFITKGDANNAPDFEPLSPENIIGRLRLRIPRIGAIAGFLNTPVGMVSLVLLLLLIIELPQLTRRGKNGGNEHA